MLLGRSNDKNIIVEKGLQPGSIVYLAIPENSEKFAMAGGDLIPVIRERNNARRLESDKTIKEPRVIASTGNLSSE